MGRHICDCGEHYDSLAAIESCQINNHGQPRPPTFIAAGTKPLLQDAHRKLKEYVDEVGGCDHSVGICCCADFALLDRINAHLNSWNECEAKECSYYQHYLAYGPADLTHEGYHAAEKHCERAQKHVDEWMKSHPNWNGDVSKCGPWRAAEEWERRVRA